MSPTIAERLLYAAAHQIWLLALAPKEILVCASRYMRGYEIQYGVDWIGASIAPSIGKEPAA